MLIRSTPQACFVTLRNGLTLELFYDEELTGAHRPTGVTQRSTEHPRRAPAGSQGVWLMGEAVLFEVNAGQA
jgi:hypothetical protein